MTDPANERGAVNFEFATKREDDVVASVGPVRPMPRLEATKTIQALGDRAG